MAGSGSSACYEASPIADAKRDAAARALLHGTVVRSPAKLTGAPTLGQMQAWENEARAGADTPPIVLFAASRLPGKPDMRRKQLSDAIAGLTGKSGAEGVLFIAQLDFWTASSGKPDPQPVFDALKAAFSATKRTGGGTWIWEEFLHSEKMNKLLSIYGDKVIELLDAAPDLEPWFKHYFRGCYEVKLAWKARGSGLADTVKPGGWEGFGEHLEKAKAEFTESWKLNPKHPAAASEMVDVAKGLSDDPLVEMRRWFERATAARFDYMPAYTALRCGLWPRWHGSEEAMMAFGRECLKTGRFDTRVPFVFIHVVRDIMSDRNETDDVYPEIARWDEMKSLIDGYIAEERRPGSLQDYQTRGAIIAWIYKKPDDCQRYLAAANHKLQDEIARDWHIDDEKQWLPQVEAATGPAGPLCRRAAEEAGREDFAAAEKTFSEALAVPGLHPLARTCLERQKVNAASLAKLAAAQWKPLFPEKDLTGWTTVFGSPVRTEDGVEAECQLMLRREAPVGPVFEIRGEVELPDAPDAYGGFAWGYPNDKDTNWMSLILGRSLRAHKSEVVLNRRFQGQTFRQPTNFGRHARVHLRVLNGRAILRLDDQVVLDRQIELVAALKPDARVALVAPLPDKGSVARWHSLEVRTPE
jgi:hypothetical protein